MQDVAGTVTLWRRMTPLVERTAGLVGRGWSVTRNRLRRPALRGLAAVGAPVLLRLCIGRWADRGERASFADGFVDGPVLVAPILRGLHAVPAAKEHVGRLATLNLVREGRLAGDPGPDADRLPGPGINGNPLSWRTERPIAFLHLEKTAGSALALALTEQMHPMQINDDPERTMPPHVRAPLVARAATDARASKLIWGHYDLPSLRRTDPGRLVFTFLREPRARLLSLYHYWRSVDPILVAGAPGNGNVHAAHRHDLAEFLALADPLIRDYVDNFYVRRLTGCYATGSVVDPVARDPDGALKAALLALASIDFVGLTERMDECLGPLGTLTDLPLPARLARRNDTVSNEQYAGARRFRKVPRSIVTAEAEALLDRLTALDRQVYAAAAAALGRRLGDQPGSAREQLERREEERDLGCGRLGRVRSVH